MDRKQPERRRTAATSKVQKLPSKTRASARKPRQQKPGARFPVPRAAFTQSNDQLLSTNPDMLRGERLLLFLLQHDVGRINRAWPDRSFSAISQMKRRALTERAKMLGTTYNEAFKGMNEDRDMVRHMVKYGCEWVDAVWTVVQEGEMWSAVKEIVTKEDIAEVVRQEESPVKGPRGSVSLEQMIVDTVGKWNALQG